MYQNFCSLSKHFGFSTQKEILEIYNASLTIKRQPHKLVKRTQTIRRQFCEIVS